MTVDRCVQQETELLAGGMLSLLWCELTRRARMQLLFRLLLWSPNSFHSDVQGDGWRQKGNNRQEHEVWGICYWVRKWWYWGAKKNKETIFWCGLSKGQQGVYFKKEIRKLQPLCFQVWNFEDMTAVWHIWLHLTSLRCTVFLFHLVLILCDDLRWKNELLSLWIVEL